MTNPIPGIRRMADSVTNDTKTRGTWGPEAAKRRSFLNEGFSGGEKKRNEILQMKLLKPKFALLDEIDSGLDVDALRVVSEAINSMRSDDFGCVMVSHYERLFELVKPTHVHVLVAGKIVLDGGYEVIGKIDQEGYDWVKELGIEMEVEEARRPIILENCGKKA